MTKNKGYSLLAAGLLLATSSAAHALQERRLEYVSGTVSWADTGVTGGGVLYAAMGMNVSTDYTYLDIHTATSGLYNARLTVACANGKDYSERPRNLVGPYFLDLDCPGSVFVVRSEGAIDDI